MPSTAALMSAPRRLQSRPSSILSAAVGPSVMAVAVNVAVTTTGIAFR